MGEPGAFERLLREVEAAVPASARASLFKGWEFRLSIALLRREGVPRLAC